MKNFLKAITVLAVTAIVCTSCASTKVDYLAESEEKTPENSVVMIFVGLYNGDYNFVQLNPEFEPDWIEFSYARPWTTPMAPGSTYLVTLLDDKNPGCWTGVPSIPEHMPFTYLNGEEPEHFKRGTRIAVPTEPGVHMVFYFLDVDTAKANGAIIIGKAAQSVDDLKNSSLGRRQVRKVIAKAAKSYAGTPWEDAINEKLKEWEE